MRLEKKQKQKDDSARVHILSKFLTFQLKNIKVYKHELLKCGDIVIHAKCLIDFQK